MSTKPSFFSRLSLLRDDSGPVLPLHKTAHAYRPLRRQPSEYNLQELPPRAEEGSSASSDAEPAFVFDSQPLPAMKKAAIAKDRVSPPVSPAWASPPAAAAAAVAVTRAKPHVLFDGPPPPIAASMLLYRDVEDRGGSVQFSPAHQRGARLDASTARMPAGSGSGSTLYDSDGLAGSGSAHTVRRTSYSIWTILQQRERSIQKDIQRYLDVQSAGLLAGLGQGPGRSVGPEPGRHQQLPSSSDAGDSFSRSLSGTPPTTESLYMTTAHTRSSRLPTDRATASGTMIPVRQPRPKKLGLRGARAGLTRGIAQLADLKTEEEASLEAALGARRHALLQLHKLTGRRDSITDELRSLEADEDEPLTRELATLSSAAVETDRQIAELEKQLAMLRTRKRTLQGRLVDVKSQRESGLSGYRGALREVEMQLASVLARPPVQPLEVEAMGGASRQASASGDENPQSPAGPATPTAATAAAAIPQSSGGVEFMRLRPERRTAEMARSWWEAEVQMLERRRKEVDDERAALEEGGNAWKEAVRLVTDFETELRRQMAGEEADEPEKDTGNGKAPEPTPEEKMKEQLRKMAQVIAGLQEVLRQAEEKNWNLLICAVGAELEAFEEAQNMFREALTAAGVPVEEEEPAEKPLSRANSMGNLLQDEEDQAATPRMVQSVVSRSTSRPTTSQQLIDTGDGEEDIHRGHAASESEDNEVPAGLLVAQGAANGAAHGPEGQAGRGGQEHDGDDSSENEVPPEFLLEHAL